MPFPQQTPIPFSVAGVETIKPGQTGCYGIYQTGGVWIYVGKGDIRERMMEHVRGDNLCIVLHNPTHWVSVVTADADNVEKRLILELSPVCNQRVG